MYNFIYKNNYFLGLEKEIAFWLEYLTKVNISR